MVMSIPDDPMFALIARFVVKDINHLTISDEHYLQQQLAEIKRHVQNAPEDKRQHIAMEWIKEHAERYRKEWQKRAISKIMSDSRCPDCPLVHGSSTSYCIIHRRWMGLLKEYIRGDINSDKYIEETLYLLGEHKESLKVSEFTGRL
jgi:hypothetical protein